MTDNIKHITDILNRTQIDTIDSLANTYPQAKERFMADDTLEMPPSNFSQMDIDTINRNLDELNSLDIDSFDLDPWNKDLYDDLIRYSIEQNMFVKSNYDYNHSSAEEKPEIVRTHDEYAKKLFDLPDKDVYLDILYHLLQKIDTDSFTEEEKKMYEELLELLPEIPDNRMPLYHPNQEVLNRLHKKVIDYYEPFLKHVPDKDTFELVDIYNIATEILNTEFADRKGKWKVLYIPNRSFASVNHIDREIKFPGNRNESHYTHDSLIMLLLHEMGVHFLRELQYDMIDIEPVRTGLRNYEKYEEGIAVSLSQIAVNSFSYSGLIHYITVGLAYFYEKSFRETYEIQKRLQYLADKSSCGRSFDSVNRTFRGTYKLINCKDLVYFNGTNAIWKYLEENIDSPTLIDDLIKAGKIDIFNEKHRRIIQEIRRKYTI